MASFDAILSTHSPSLHGDDALAVIVDIFFFEKQWRCYPAAAHPTLIHQFLNAHAKTLGLGGGEVLALNPIDIFDYLSPGGLFGNLHFRGGVFLNGAVLRATGTEGEIEDLLFVDEATAHLWRYPANDYFYFAEHFPDAKVFPPPPATS